MMWFKKLIACFGVALPILCWGQSKTLVFQSDFGLKDGAVSAMKGVSYSVDNGISIFDITHDIPAYNIWEAAYRLRQAAPYWPAGTVFVSVIDPGVGTERKSIVMKSKSGHYFVTPDNGTLTLVAEYLGVEEVREIDEATNRLRDSNQSYTFHGRDVYAYTGARLAAGVIRFEEVGAVLKSDLVTINYQKPSISDGKITGTIDILDIQYGNVWTNIDQSFLNKLGLNYGARVHVTLYHVDKKVFDKHVLFGRTFGDVQKNMAVAYLNSLLNFSIGINQGNFAKKFKIGSGPEWRVVIEK
jgi:S-adenosylmethionine hydrolase